MKAVVKLKKYSRRHHIVCALGTGVVLILAGAFARVEIMTKSGECIVIPTVAHILRLLGMAEEEIL